MGTGNEVADVLQGALRAAMKDRDTVAASALRSVLAAIANAEAVPVGPGTATAASQHVAGGTAGVGSGEAERRRLTPEETDRIVRDEISEREAAARQYEDGGHPERAGRLRREARVIRAALPPGV